MSGVDTKKGKAEVTPYDLSKRWNISLETAKKTLLKATQRKLRTSPNPLLSQQYSTNDRMRYRRLPVDSLLTHLRQGEILSLLFAQEGVPSTLVMDGAREQVMGELR